MKTWMKILLGLIIIGIIGAYFGYREFNRGHPDYAEAKAELSVEASKLYLDFTTKSDEAYKTYVGEEGKVIEIEGKISKVELIGDTLAVLVYAFNEGLFGDEGIRLTMLPEFTEESKKLQPDMNVLVKGLCTGYNDVDVIVEKGSIVK